MINEYTCPRKDYKRYQLSNAWQVLEAGELYVVIHNHHYYVESPEEARENDRESVRESVLRVFITQGDAVEYMEQIADTRSIPRKELAVLHTDLADLYRTISLLNLYSHLQHEAPLRVDLCVVNPGEWPKSIDTIWTSMGWRN